MFQLTSLAMARPTIALFSLVNWFVNPSVVFLCSGRLLRTFADVKYGNYHLTTVEIVYNTLSLIVAIVTTVAFTVYAKNALNELKRAENSGEEESASDHVRLEMEKLPLEKPHIFTL